MWEKAWNRKGPLSKGDDMSGGTECSALFIGL